MSDRDHEETPALDEYELSDDLDRRETVDDTGSRLPTESTLFRVFAWLVVASPLLLAGAGGVVVLLAELAGFSIPRPLHVGAIAFALTAPTVGRWVGGKAKDWLWDPNWVYAVDLDAREQKGAIYRWPSQQFRELEVTVGSLDWLSPNLVCCKNIDMNAGTLEGTWRGTFSDRDLLRAISVVYECRGQLEDDAKRGFALETQAFGIVRRATQGVTRRLVENFEKHTLPDEGEALASEIETAIDQYGLEDRLDQIDETDPDEQDLNMNLNELDGFNDDVTFGKEASADD
jgi:hypothetical protein